MRNDFKRIYIIYEATATLALFFIYAMICIMLQMKIYVLHFISMFVDRTWRNEMSNSSQSINEEMRHATSNLSNDSSSSDEWWSLKLNVTSCIFENVCLWKSDMLYNVDILSQFNDDISPIIVTIYYWHFEYHSPICCSVLHNGGFLTHT